LKFFRCVWDVLLNRRGSQTIEYVTVLVGAAILAMILVTAMESDEIQNALKEKIECAFTQKCSKTEIASKEKVGEESGYIPGSTLAPLEDNLPESVPSLNPLSLHDPDANGDHSGEQAGETNQFNQKPTEDEGFFGMLKRKAGEVFDQLSENDFVNDFSYLKDSIEDIKEGNIPSLILRVQPSGLFYSFFKDRTGFDLHEMWMNNPGALITTLAGGVMTAFPPTSALGIGVLSMGGLGGLLTGIQGGSENNVADAIVFGGLSGAFGFGAGMLAFKGASSIGTNVLRNSPWFQRWLPIGAGGGVGGAVEDASLGWMTEGKLKWKQALAVGALGAVLGVGGGFLLEKAAPPVMNALKDYGIIANADGTLSNPFLFRQFDDAGDGYRKASGSGSGTAFNAKKPPKLSKGDPNFSFKTEWDDQAQELWARTSDGREFKVRYGDRRNTVDTQATEVGNTYTVKYDKDGFPDFTPYAVKGKNGKLLEITLPTDALVGESQDQTRYATQLLKEQYPNWKTEFGFTDSQIKAIEKNKGSIGPGLRKNKAEQLTWHHDKETGKMILVPWDLNITFKHSGGHAFWGSQKVK
jgi:hypothetical protein